MDQNKALNDIYIYIRSINRQILGDYIWTTLKCKKSCLSIPTAVHDHPKDGLPLNFPVDMRYPRIWYINIIYIYMYIMVSMLGISKKIYMYNIENLVFLVGNLCTSSDLPWKISPVESPWRFWAGPGMTSLTLPLKRSISGSKARTFFSPVWSQNSWRLNHDWTMKEMVLEWDFL